MTRLLIVHEVRLIADLTASVLQMEPDFEVATCVYTPDAALNLLRKSRYDVLLVSITLPNQGAALLTRGALQIDSLSKILITGLVEAKSVILPWLEAGAVGYVHPDESVADLLRKIRSVSAGEFPVSPTLAAMLIAHIGKLKQQVIELNGLQTLNLNTLAIELTTREHEVLSLIEQSYSNQGIGNALYIELGTVKNHVHNILDKLGVRTRHQAAIIARQTLANAAVSIKM